MVLAEKLVKIRWLSLGQWWLVFLTALLPLLLLLQDALSNRLGVDPAKTIVDELGTWAMIFLWLTLAVTPARLLLNWRTPIRYRRMLGLFAFAYASLHLAAVITFILGWRADLLVREVTERPYVIVGFLAFLILLPLALTSTKGWQLRLGRRWRSLHRWIYLASILVLLHFIWLIRASYSEALFYGLILAFLLGIRLYKNRNGRTR